MILLNRERAVYGSGLCLPVLDHINAIYISACFLALKIFISMFLSFKF